MVIHVIIGSVQKSLASMAAWYSEKDDLTIIFSIRATRSTRQLFSADT